MSLCVTEDVTVDLCVSEVVFEWFTSVASLLGAVESSSAWVNDDRDDDSLYSRAPQVASPAWLKAASAPTLLLCVCVSYCQALCLFLSLSGVRCF